MRDVLRVPISTIAAVIGIAATALALFMLGITWQEIPPFAVWPVATVSLFLILGAMLIFTKVSQAQTNSQIATLTQTVLRLEKSLQIAVRIFAVGRDTDDSQDPDPRNDPVPPSDRWDAWMDESSSPVDPPILPGRPASRWRGRHRNPNDNTRP